MEIMNIDAPYIKEQLRHLALPIESVSLDPDNARTHGNASIEAIMNSLMENGQYYPIIVQREGMIVRAGNGRLTAAKALGWKYIACIVVDANNIEATKIALADNKTAELSTWNEHNLKNCISILAKIDKTTPKTLGFTDNETKKMLGLLKSREERKKEAEGKIKEVFNILIECTSEQQQRELLEELNKRGIKCRSLIC